jgi:hypothetical protein
MPRKEAEEFARRMIINGSGVVENKSKPDTTRGKASPIRRQSESTTSFELAKSRKKK